MKIKKILFVLIIALTIISFIHDARANAIASQSFKNFVFPNLHRVTLDMLVTNVAARNPGYFGSDGLYVDLFLDYTMKFTLSTAIVASLSPITMRGGSRPGAGMLPSDNAFSAETIIAWGTTYQGVDLNRRKVIKVLRNLETDIYVASDMEMNFPTLLTDIYFTMQYALNEGRTLTGYNPVLPYLAILDAMVASEVWISSKINSLQMYNDAAGFQQFCTFLNILEAVTIPAKDAQLEGLANLAVNNNPNNALEFGDEFLASLRNLNEPVTQAYARAKEAIDASGNPERNDLLVFTIVNRMRDRLIHLGAYQSGIYGEKIETESFIPLASQAAESIAVFLYRLGAIDQETAFRMIQKPINWFRSIQVHPAIAFGGLRYRAVNISAPLSRVDGLNNIIPQALTLQHLRF